MASRIVRDVGGDLLGRAWSMLPRPEELEAIDVAAVCDGAADAVASIRYRDDMARYRVLLKRAVYSGDILRVEREAQRDSIPPLLVVEHVTPSQAEAMRAAGIQFLDAAGNGFLHLGDLYLFVVGRARPRDLLKPESPRLFKDAGLKVLFVCLAELTRAGEPESEILNASYRELALAAGVSLGSVSGVRKELMASPYVEQFADDRLLLIHRQDLLNRWVDAYAERLRPKLHCRRYRAPRVDWWKEAELDPALGLWGGEAASAKMTGYLKPEMVTVYRHANLNRFLLENGLSLDPSGDVEVLDAFWGDDELRDKDCVPAVLTYADLVASGSERNVEAAKELYEQRLRAAIEAA